MKNIAGFAVLVIIIRAFSPAPVYGQSQRRYVVGVAPRFGMIYGQAEEIVYPGGNTKNRLLSQLLWDLKPLWYGGVEVDFSRREPLAGWGFFAAASLQAGIPGNTGTMEDRDWQSVVNSSLTNYSVHDNRTNGFFRAAGALGLSVPVRSFLLLKLNANVAYMRFDFSGHDGSAAYAREDPDNPGVFFPIGDRPHEYSFSGKVINYTQDWLTVAPGFSLDFRLPGRFSAELLFQASPLIWCSDADEHLQRNLEFRDFLRWGIFFEPRGKIGWSPLPGFELSLELGYRYIGEARGETYWRLTSDEQYTREGEAGAGLSILDAGLLFKIRL